MNFAEIIRGVAGSHGIALPPPHHPEPLAGLAYADELALKNEALASFWRQQGLPGRPQPIVPAPIPRGYRTTSKRRATYDGNRLTLSFPGAAPPPSGVAPSALDPAEHAAVYDLLVDALARPPGRPLSRVLNHAIVRGRPGALALVLNVRELDARVVRGAKLLADRLQTPPATVRAAFLYLDPSGSDYYLEARRPTGTLAFKHLFGPGFLDLDAGGLSLRFPPTVFSQVNAAMVPAMIETARQLLAPLAARHLLDLYCGYGLFSLTLGDEAAQVTGMDLDGPAITAARANAAHLDRSRRTRFLAGKIDAVAVARLPVSRGAPELVLLDPPRQGTAPGVVAELAARRPERVVHVCCGTDEMPREVAAWRAAGYVVCRATPLDLFAGTANLETLLLLGP